MTLNNLQVSAQLIIAAVRSPLSGHVDDLLGIPGIRLHGNLHANREFLTWLLNATVDDGSLCESEVGLVPTDSGIAFAKCWGQVESETSS
jgi:hypothetical protein